MENVKILCSSVSSLEIITLFLKDKCPEIVILLGVYWMLVETAASGVFPEIPITAKVS